MLGGKREPGTLCPLLNKACVKHDCTWYTQVRGHNPNTGAEIDQYSCAVAWLPILMIENSQQQRQTSAAVESFRNEMVRANDLNRDLLLAEAKHKSLPR